MGQLVIFETDQIAGEEAVLDLPAHRLWRQDSERPRGLAVFEDLSEFWLAKGREGEVK